MKLILTSIAASSLLAALAVAQPAPRYTITDLGTLGGTYSYAYGNNNEGWVAGGAATPTQTDGVSETAFLWHNGHIINLGTLGGPNSGAGGPNARGEAVLSSETSKPDPNSEDFCGFGTHLQCLAATWKHGELTALPNLPGGNNAAAFGINNRGEIVGFAETDTTDVCATPFQALRFEAVIWEPNGQIRELLPLKGDTVAFAFGINDHGQAVGSSGLCSNTTLPPLAPSGPHAVLWEKDGSVIDLGNLGGTNNIAGSINDRGEVVGTSQSAKDGTIHAFLWTKHKGMQDLGAYPGAVATVAPCCHSINNRGEVIGFAIDGTTFNFRALVWQDQVPMDLNQFIPAGSGWYLEAAETISDNGEIVGYGTINGQVHAFLATPKCRRESH
jgi:probable HAF family extracellular repeat protein